MSDPSSEPEPTDRTPTEVGSPTSEDPLQRAMARLAAGVLAEGGKADKKAAKAVQAAIEGGSFDPDGAAASLLPGILDTRQEEWLESRSKGLMRDLVMAPKLRGVAGAGRSARQAGRNLFAYVFTQLIVLLLFALLFTAGVGLMRYQGIDVQGFVDRGLSAIGLEPGAGAKEGSAGG